MVDSGQAFGALLADLRKGFDCLPLELLLTKLNAYEFIVSALRLICKYLFNRKQRTKINAIYSSWEDILFGVPQGSILGPLILNIFMCDLFIIFEETDFAGYLDDNAPFVSKATIVSKNVMSSQESCSANLFE